MHFYKWLEKEQSKPTKSLKKKTKKKSKKITVGNCNNILDWDNLEAFENSTLNIYNNDDNYKNIPNVDYSKKTKSIYYKIPKKIR